MTDVARLSNAELANQLVRLATEVARRLPDDREPDPGTKPI